mgnify:CR=1 FL=1
MPTIERGPYEPPPEDPRVYDAAEDDQDDEGSRLPLLIVIALLVLASFAGVVWLAYSQGVARGRGDAPQIIAAEPGPVKTAPTPNDRAPQSQIRGLKIYENPAPDDDQVPEEPSSQAASPNVAPSANPAGSIAAKPVPAVNKPAAAASMPAPRKPVAAARHADERPAAVAAKPAEKSSVVETSSLPPPASAAKPVAAGAFMLQIGAYKSEAEANAAWSTYKGKHSAVLGGQGHDTQKVDLGAKGTWYRLRVGPFGSRADATAACGKLKADGGACFLAH